MVWETARMRSVTLVGWESATRCEAPIWTMWAPAPAGPPPRGTGSITKEGHAVTPPWGGWAILRANGGDRRSAASAPSTEGARRGHRRLTGAPLGRRHARPPLAARPRPGGAEALPGHQGGAAPPDGPGRRPAYRPRAAVMGGRPQRPGAGGGARLSRPLRRDGAPGAAGPTEPGQRRRLARAAGHARHALHLPQRAQPPLPHRRHRRLALARRRARRHPPDGAGAR